MTAEDIASFKVDRAGWPAGEWDTEPDRVDFVFAGLACLMLRGYMGQWCGYAGVPKGHHYYGKRYSDVALEVHGGVNYSEECSPPICHVPEPGTPDNLWWLGFDCGHLRDIVPRDLMLEATLPDRLKLSREITDYPQSKYRNMAYVRTEVEMLASQLAQPPGLR